MALDVTTRSAAPVAPEDCGKVGERCVPLLHDGLDFVMDGAPDKGRFAVLEMPDGGELVVEQCIRPVEAFAAGLRLLRPVVDGLTLAG